jgi:2-(1,2-epoxy-1,2-dihydrophenyl)acetyl-CoA isomerase
MSEWDMLTEHSGLRATVRDGAVRIELRRPQVLNAFDDALFADFLALLREIGPDPAVRAVMITGAGRAFSAGADVKSEFGDGAGVDVEQGLRELVKPTILALREMPKPVLAAVNGLAAGVGCSLALACDLVVAAQSSYFLLAFANIGLSPDGGSTLTVPARVGMARAFVMALLAERVQAPEAREWGLVDRVVPDAEFAQSTEALLLRLAAGPTQSYAATKQAINASCLPGLAAQLDLETELQVAVARSDDFTEGVTAFAEKRVPTFHGS